MSTRIVKEVNHYKQKYHGKLCNFVTRWNPKNYIEFLTKESYYPDHNTRHVDWNAHFGIAFRNVSYTNYSQWIGQRDTVGYPPTTPDHNSLEFYFWRYMKDEILDQFSNSWEQLLERIQWTAQPLRENKHTIIDIGAQACIQHEGGHFQNIVNWRFVK